MSPHEAFIGPRYFITQGMLNPMQANIYKHRELIFTTIFLDDPFNNSSIHTATFQ